MSKKEKYQPRNPVKMELKKIDAATGEIIANHTWSPSQLSEGGEFMVVYQEAMIDVATRGLSKTAMQVLFYLFGNCDWDGEIDMPQSHMATALKRDKSDISKACKELESAGIIYKRKVYGRGRFTFNPRYATKGKSWRDKLRFYQQLAAADKLAEAKARLIDDEADRAIAEIQMQRMPAKEKREMERIIDEVDKYDAIYNQDY